ncbi:MAG: hypothetical protein CMM56_03985 [Rhodospirillaceae bacterium]|nr:hypothetical protein [Rhodospirillaceae bacterium]|tara:strand:+ start:225 stop:485 length:261 start_codon:yes stop_codon:yes gene_type:complete
MLWLIISFIIFLALWGLAWRSQPKLALGILVGLCLGVPLSGFLGPYESLADVPMWLPPLPFMIITLIFLIYGFLAWRILDANKKSN